MNDKDYNCYVGFRLTNFRGSCVDDKNFVQTNQTFVRAN